MEAKQLIFLAMTAAFIPVASWFGIRYRWAERLLVAGAFFSTSYLVDINLLSMEWYRGDTKGFEFGVTDWMIISLIIVMAKSPRWRRKRPELFPPNSALMLAYLLLALASLAVAFVPVYAAFGAFKILRAMAVYWVAYNYLRSEEDLRFVLYILAAIVAFEFLLVLQQRAGGIYRVFGTTPHSNTLAVYVNMMNMVFFSFVLSDRERGIHRYVYWACFAMGSLIVLATFSRGALAAMILSYAIVVMLSLFDRPRAQKFKVVGLLVLLAIPVAVRVAPAIIERFETAPEEAEISRHQANAAAVAMAGESILGVGLNNYSHVINNTAYTEFIPLETDRGIVHNIYLLHASEMGWLGLGVFVLMIVNFLWMALRVIVRREDNAITYMAIGIFAAMLALWLQSWLEWLFRQTYITVQFYMLAGFLAALPRLAREQRRMERVQAAQRLWLRWARAQRLASR